MATSGLLLESSWNVMAHGDAWEGKWSGNWRMEWVASTLHATPEHCVSSITTADAQTSAASCRLNWRPRWFKWTRPFRRKTKSGFCACAITFQTQSAIEGFIKHWGGKLQSRVVRLVLWEYRTTFECIVGAFGIMAIPFRHLHLHLREVNTVTPLRSRLFYSDIIQIPLTKDNLFTFFSKQSLLLMKRRYNKTWT
jgi:hypothetical protein